MNLRRYFQQLWKAAVPPSFNKSQLHSPDPPFHPPLPRPVISPVVAEFFQGTPDQIPSIRLVRILDRYVVGRQGDFAHSHASIGMIAAVPLLVEGFLLTAWPHSACTGESLIWLLYYAGFNCYALLCPTYTWARLMRISPDIDAMLWIPTQQRHFVAWMTKRVNLRKQLRPALAAVLVGLVILRIIDPVLRSTVAFCFASYVSVAISAFLMLNNTYWVINLAAIVRRISSYPSLRFSWPSPADTPGVDELSRLLGWTSLVTAGGVLVGIIPIVYTSSAAEESLVPILAMSCFGSIALVLFAGIFPQYWLSRAIRIGKGRLLRDLDTVIGALPRSVSSESELEGLDRRANLYRAISSSPNSTLRSGTIAQYAGAIIASIVTVAVAIGAQ